MTGYYDRQGNPMTTSEWALAFEAASDAKKAGNGRHVGYDETNDHLVSTVWLGLDHQFGSGPPLIFETMIFCHHEPCCDLNEWTTRYSTEADAEQGHAKAVALVDAYDQAAGQ